MLHPNLVYRRRKEELLAAVLPGEWSSGDEPGRSVASPPAPSGPETGSGVDLVHLTDLADLAELADEEVVTSWRSKWAKRRVRQHDR